MALVVLMRTYLHASSLAATLNTRAMEVLALTLLN